MVPLNFLSRISQGIRLFIFILSGLLSAVSIASASEPTTDEGRTNRSAFPMVKYQDRYSLVPPTIESALREKIEQVLTPVRLRPESWFKSTFGSSATAGERARIFDSFSETEIWRCSSDYCRECPSAEYLGCVLGAKRPNGYGVVAVIHPCLYGEGKCVKKGSIDGWAERAVSTIPYYKLGLRAGARPLEKFQTDSAAWIHKTSAAVNEILGACPGPYSKKAMTFLTENGGISEPNAALKACSAKYLSAIRNLPETCKILKTEAKEAWAGFTKDYLSKNPEVLRADSFSRKMFCRNREARTLFTGVETNPVLFLFDGACEGEAPTSITDFIRAALPRGLKARLDTSGCLPKGSVKKSEESGTGDLSNGPEIQLEPN